MRTVPIQVVCRNCAQPYRTTVRGGNTRCPHCRTSRHVRVEQEWEGPVTAEFSAAAARADQVAARPAVWVECRCGHEWQSRARDRMTIRCPECSTGQRVPYRTYANTGPTPEGYRPPPPSPARPARMRPAPAWERDNDPEGEWEPEQGRTSLTEALSGILAALRRPAPVLPTPAAPRPARPARPAAANRPAPARTAPRPTAPAPAPRSAPTLTPATPLSRARIVPIDVSTLPLREQGRRDRISQIVRSLSAPLMVWYDTPPGLCEVLDTTLPRDQRRCPRTATHAVTFWQADGTDATACTCTAHADPLAATALRSAYVQASPYRIR